jgi:hypothetical protein
MKRKKISPHNSAGAICEAILCQSDTRKTQEYIGYFKFSKLSYGAKLPQSVCITHKMTPYTTLAEMP